jgi:PadR family transcriptional regulator PadR
LHPEPMTLLQGTLDLLFLNSLVTGEMHGLGVSRRVQQITGGTFIVKPGSLFPALHRMEEEGWISSFWGDSENNRSAKFYRLTKAGRKQLEVRNQAMGPHFLGYRASFGSIVEKCSSCRSL